MFLIAVFPLVMISYAIDKIGDAKSQAFDAWVKEFMFNVFVQSFHAISYVLIMSIVFALMDGGSVDNYWLVILIALSFISKGDDILRGIFALGGKANTVKSIGSTIAEAAAIKSIAGGVKAAKNKLVGPRSLVGVASYVANKNIQKAWDKKDLSTREKEAELALGELSPNYNVVNLNDSEEVISKDINDLINAILGKDGKKYTDEELRNYMNRLTGYINKQVQDERVKNILERIRNGNLTDEEKNLLNNLLKANAVSNDLAVGGREINVDQKIDIIISLLKGRQDPASRAILGRNFNNIEELRTYNVLKNMKFKKEELRKRKSFSDDFSYGDSKYARFMGRSIAIGRNIEDLEYQSSIDYRFSNPRVITGYNTNYSRRTFFDPNTNKKFGNGGAVYTSGSRVSSYGSNGAPIGYTTGNGAGSYGTSGASTGNGAGGRVSSYGTSGYGAQGQDYVGVHHVYKVSHVSGGTRTVSGGNSVSSIGTTRTQISKNSGDGKSRSSRVNRVSRRANIPGRSRAIRGVAGMSNSALVNSTSKFNNIPEKKRKDDVKIIGAEMHEADTKNNSVITSGNKMDSSSVNSAIKYGVGQEKEENIPNGTTTNYGNKVPKEKGIKNNASTATYGVRELAERKKEARESFKKNEKEDEKSSSKKKKTNSSAIVRERTSKPKDTTSTNQNIGSMIANRSGSIEDLEEKINAPDLEIRKPRFTQNSEKSGKSKVELLMNNSYIDLSDEDKEELEDISSAVYAIAYNDGEYTQRDTLKNIEYVKKMLAKNENSEEGKKSILAGLLQTLKCKLEDYETGVRIEILNNPSCVNNNAKILNESKDYILANKNAISEIFLSSLNYDLDDLENADSIEHTKQTDKNKKGIATSSEREKIEEALKRRKLEEQLNNIHEAKEQDKYKFTAKGVASDVWQVTKAAATNAIDIGSSVVVGGIASGMTVDGKQNTFFQATSSFTAGSNLKDSVYTNAKESISGIISDFDGLNPIQEETKKSKEYYGPIEDKKMTRREYEAKLKELRNSSKIDGPLF